MTSPASPNITSYFNRGPLTTAFAPPTTCLQTLSEVVYYVDGTAESTTYYGHWYGDYTGYTCLPTGTVPGTLLASPTYWDTYWYSPGLYCPTGWTTAGQLAGSWNGLDVAGSTSGAICCPSGMNFYSQNHECSQVLSAKDTITVAATGVAVLSTLTTPITIYADGIPLIWEKSDLPKTTSAATTPLSTPPLSTSPLSTQTLTAASATATNSSNNDKSGGLSKGAKIGIGIGIPVGAIAIGVAIFFYFLNRHKRHKEELRAMTYASPRGRETLSEIATKEHSELSELPRKEDRSELPLTTPNLVHELS
ncbi:hypothetical protein N7510_009967 [Penicillium lagena]|uniref:uncharacterized protein n=1 Tax=Penicillium lagena TaxID=94218 RepID=UPI0025412288|nr:uncharacterized protein N7510_009967 [Penicillium lagena]KAJ5604813.1 hypothetical protein N7510_009967 [Penicillium lagena]